MIILLAYQTFLVTESDIANLILQGKTRVVKLLAVEQNVVQTFRLSQLLANSIFYPKV